MKFLDKLALKIFSLIIIILVVVVALLLSGIVDAKLITEQIAHLTDGELAIKITIGVLAVLILLALKGLFFTSKSENAGKDGIILENANGKLLISKESLENLIASVIKEVPGADSISSRTILDRDRNLIINVTAAVSKDIMLKDVSNEIQARIKDAMKRTADLEVKEVNIKIKNITNKRVTGLPAAESDEPLKNDTDDNSSENIANAEELLNDVDQNLENDSKEDKEEE
jgi:uncharacterized alkaline shock family protein YloU